MTDISNQISSNLVSIHYFEFDIDWYEKIMIPTFSTLRMDAFCDEIRDICEIMYQMI